MKGKIKAAIGIGAAVAVAAGVLGAGAEYFFRLGFETRKKGEGVDMTVWDPASGYKRKRSRAHGRMKKRRTKSAGGDCCGVSEDELQLLMEEGRRWILEMDPERWHITSHDGLPLTAHYIPADSPKGLFLMVHGYRSNGTGDFSCAARSIYERGISLLIIDNRGCGESGGRYMSYGTLERYDVLRWTEEIQRRLGDIPVILDGISMGAATVLMATALPLPETVKGVVADCGYTTPTDIFRSVMKRLYHLPASPFLPIARVMCRRRGGFDFAAASAAEAVKKTRIPILYAHGTGDTFVPYEMTLENCGNTPPEYARLLTVKGAEHGRCYICGREAYELALDLLVRDCFGE